MKENAGDPGAPQFQSVIAIEKGLGSRSVRTVHGRGERYARTAIA